jgi:osmotically inducible protein OsmC
VTPALYTAVATASHGGRDGAARSDDGRLDVALDVPRELGGSGGPGTNPEQLFAAGYAACFASAIRYAARTRARTDGCEVTASVGLVQAAEHAFALVVELDVQLPALSQADAEALVAAADLTCPYSNAIRDNVQVTRVVRGTAA